MRTPASRVSSAMVMLAARCTADDGTHVRVIDNDVEPQPWRIAAADTVAWTSEGSHDHNVVGDGFKTKTRHSSAWTYTLDERGATRTKGTLHIGVLGDIVVTD